MLVLLLTTALTLLSILLLIFHCSLQWPSMAAVPGATSVPCPNGHSRCTRPGNSPAG
jgi:hypothetical protein